IRGGQDFCGDLDEVGIQVAGIPFLEHLGDFGWFHACSITQQLVCLTDDLHIGVFDAVVHHLDKWPAPSGPMWVTHGVPSTTAAMDSKIGPSVFHDSAGPPGMMDGPLRAPSSPPEIPAPTK